MKKLFFFDFEASSLMGYPIEIGWAELDLDSMEITSKSYLIRPTDFWWEQDDLWDHNAESLHGYDMSDLMDNGLDVADVCDRADAALGDNIAYTDNASYDGRWADMLYQEAGRQRAWRCVEIGRLFENIDPLIIRNSLARAREQVPVYHKADKDAERHAWAWFFALHGGG